MCNDLSTYCTHECCTSIDTEELTLCLSPCLNQESRQRSVFGLEGLGDVVVTDFDKNTQFGSERLADAVFKAVRLFRLQ